MFRIALCLLCASRPLAAAEHLNLYAGESRIVSVNSPKKTVVGNKAIADARSLSDTELLLSGKAPGLTSLVIWGAGDERTSYEIEVTPSGLKKDMIEIDVQVLEISDLNTLDAGIDWPALVNSAGKVSESAPPLLAFGTFNRGPIDIALKALVQDNKAKLLAKPKLLTISGGSAKFLSGGEVPVLHQDTQGHSNTEYKEYGVSLNIQPRSDEHGDINASIRAEVSNLDDANAIQIGGSVIPALKTRWVDTSIFVKKDGTIVIAGMITEEKSSVTKGIPVLSLIPLIGELFKVTHLETKNSELVIFVTPRVI